MIINFENNLGSLTIYSKTVADLKTRFPSLQENLKGLLSSEMEKIVHEEKFLKEEPERLEFALRRCKKLTGTLVTLKRLVIKENTDNFFNNLLHSFLIMIF